MLDTNTVSYIVTGRSPSARERLASLNKHEIGCISIITEAELRYGVAKSRKAQVQLASLEGFFARVQVLTWGKEEALAYGQLRAKQEAAGKTLQNLDMLIAAHAIAVGAILVTADKAFSRVPDIPGAINWALEFGNPKA